MSRDNKKNENEKIAMKVSTTAIVVNILLSVFKFLAGVFAHSHAMISDSIHSASDVFSTIFVIIGVKLANRDSDEKHQYGHERIECIAAIILAIALGCTGVGIGISAVKKIQNTSISPIAVPGTLALVAAITSIVVKEAMYWYTYYAAKSIRSNALMADAWHHRSDAFSSIGSLIGIVGAMLGCRVLDPISSIVICLLIVKTAVGIFWDSVRKMIDEACSLEFTEKICNEVLSVDKVLGIDLIKTRMFGNKVYVDIEILANGNQTLKQAHHIAEAVHDRVEEKYPEVKHIMIHVNPTDED